MVVSIKDKVWHATPPKYVSPGRLHIFHKNQKNTYSGSHYHFAPVLIPITSLTDYTIRTIPTITHLLPHPLHCTDRRSLAHTTCIPFFRAPYILPSFFLHSSYLITHHPLTPLSLLSVVHIGHPNLPIHQPQSLSHPSTSPQHSPTSNASNSSSFHFLKHRLTMSTSSSLLLVALAPSTPKATHSLMSAAIVNLLSST